jgi:leader peptidase (prepilin peptidase)/N-methyltransferase
LPTGLEADPTTAEILWNSSTWFFWALNALVFGLLFGSFFNVCIYRIPAGLSVFRPKWSFCFRCGSKVRWYDNIPVISYFVLGGKCRECGGHFSLRYALVELLTGLLFLAVFAGINPPGSESFQWATFWYLAFTGLLIVGTFTDLDHWIIPDGITIYGTVVALLAALVIGVVDGMPLLAKMGPFPVVREFHDDGSVELVLALLQGPVRSGMRPDQLLWWEPFVNGVIGAAWGVGLLWAIMVLGKVIFRKDAMGMGDVKLFALIGATLGAMGSMLALAAACMVGATVGMAMIAWSKVRTIEESVLEQGAVLEKSGTEESAGSEDAWRGELAETCRRHAHPSRVHHLPFGPYIAVGALIVLIFHDWIQKALFGQ